MAGFSLAGLPGFGNPLAIYNTALWMNGQMTDVGFYCRTCRKSFATMGFKLAMEKKRTGERCDHCGMAAQDSPPQHPPALAHILYEIKGATRHTLCQEQLPEALWVGWGGLIYDKVAFDKGARSARLCARCHRIAEAGAL